MVYAHGNQNGPISLEHVCYREQRFWRENQSKSPPEQLYRTSPLSMKDERQTICFRQDIARHLNRLVTRSLHGLEQQILALVDFCRDSKSVI